MPPEPRPFTFEIDRECIETTPLADLGAAEAHAFRLGRHEAVRRRVSSVEVDVRNANGMRVLTMRAKR